MTWIFQGIVVFIVATLVMSSVSTYVETPVIPPTDTFAIAATTTYAAELPRKEFCEDMSNTGLSGWYTADPVASAAWTTVAPVTAAPSAVPPVVGVAAPLTASFCRSRFVIGQVGDTIVILIPLALVFLIMAAVGLGTSVTGYGKVFRGYKAGRGMAEGM